MKSVLLLALGLALASAAAVQDEATQAKHRKVFFKDVPGAPASHEHGLRIYNGGIASRTQFPYQAGLYLDFNGFCGGSLIHKNWVLTAAHCVDGFKTWSVFLGLSNMLEAKQEGRVVHVSNTATRHELYQSDRIINDIGVVYLRRGVELNNYIALSRLAPAGVNYAGRTATVSGFGLVEDSGTQVISPVLKYTSLPVVSSAVCWDYYYDADQAPKPVDVSQICLKAVGTSSCSGDSGGPLTVTEPDGSVIQIGLTSYGSSAGCTIGAPVGFTRVNYFYDWLTKTTGVNFS